MAPGARICPPLINYNDTLWQPRFKSLLDSSDLMANKTFIWLDFSLFKFFFQDTWFETVVSCLLTCLLRNSFKCRCLTCWNGWEGKDYCWNCGGKLVLFVDFFQQLVLHCAFCFGERERNKGRCLRLRDNQKPLILASRGGSLHDNWAVSAFICWYKRMLSSCLMKHLPHPSCILSQQQQQQRL